MILNRHMYLRTTFKILTEHFTQFCFMNLQLKGPTQENPIGGFFDHDLL